MRIRPAQPADAAQIAAVHVRSWQAAYQGLVPQRYLDQLTPAQRRPAWERQIAASSWPRQAILVAETGGQVAGFAALCPTRDHDQDREIVAEIAAIYLSPEAWNRGTGRQLMTCSLRVLARAGYHQATLWVLETNLRARRFYEATGWKHDGTIKHDHTRGFPLTEIRYRHPVSTSNVAPAGA